MAGDYTRLTFDPAKGFSGVLKQQGRVSLDSDDNQFEQILDRRLRAQMYDTVGRAVVPITTKSGFEIGLAGKELTIGIGRAYVDGILAECFGNMADAAKTVRDDVLGGVVGSGALRIEQQPFFYSPKFPGLEDKNKISTVYLDVWQREVTVWEDPTLREPALNGPDTATRMQTAWQVKVMKEEAKSSNCADVPNGWQALIAPSTARLTATANGVAAPPPGPCAINPAGGYTGLENRLYRVEVHKAGTVGGAVKAEFKWSRDNASLAASVVSVTNAGSPTDWIITVKSTGRDAWTRFAHDDHLELLDDDIEFAMRESGIGGRMVQVVSVVDTTGRITVKGNLVGFTVHPARHPRVRKWDIQAANEPTTRPVGANIPLEEGISVTFEGAATDTLHAGDYWVFAARTADGSIEALVKAPPRGTLHHFAKLALVTHGHKPTDCRIFWPPTFTGGGGGGEACCSVTVKPGDDIQAAIDSLHGSGGCVCLKMGVHTIQKALTIDQGNITLHAEAPWVTVRLANAGPRILQILPTSNGQNISVLGITFEAKDTGTVGAMISIEGVHGGRIGGCVLGFVNGVANANSKAVGIQIDDCNDYSIEDNGLAHFVTGIAGEENNRLRIVGNQLTGSTAAHGTDQWSAGTMGIKFTDTQGIAVERNLIANYRRGIQIGDPTATGILQPVDLGKAEVGYRIADNVVTRTGGNPSDSLLPTSLAFGVAVRAPRAEVLENAVQIGGPADGGILAICGDALIARNVIPSSVTFTGIAPLRLAPRGVIVTARTEESLMAVVRDNFFSGLQQAVLVGGAGTKALPHRADVLSNDIVGSSELYKMVSAAVGDKNQLSTLIPLIALAAAIDITQITLGRVAGNTIVNAIAGVLTNDVTGVVVADNSILDSACGVMLGASNECEVTGNIIGAALFGGVVTMITTRSVVARNVIGNTALGVVDLGSTVIRVENNDVYGGVHGVQLTASADAEVRGNNVQAANVAGIVAMATRRALTLSHNRLLDCGYRADGPVTSDPAYGIAVKLSDALVCVDACQALNTGEADNPAASQAAPFLGQRCGVFVQSTRARVHHCVISSRSIAKKTGGPGAHPKSCALLIGGGQTQSSGGPSTGLLEVAASHEAEGANVGPGTVADVSDNLAEQTADTVVRIEASEVMFNSNRCTMLDSEPPTTSTVNLTADNAMVVTSNRVRAPGDRPSLQLRVPVTGRLSVMGNVATGTIAITGGINDPNMAPPRQQVPLFNVKD